MKDNSYKNRKDMIHRLYRKDAEDEGGWITTENGHHVHLNEEGEPDKGNKEVINAMNGHQKSEEEPKNKKIPKMKKTVDIDKEYNSNATKSIRQFFKTHPELDYWKEQFEWMNENDVDFLSDTKMADGTKNDEWTYALHLEKYEGDHTYMAIIEREPNKEAGQS